MLTFFWPFQLLILVCKEKIPFLSPQELVESKICRDLGQPFDTRLIWFFSLTSLSLEVFICLLELLSLDPGRWHQFHLGSAKLSCPGSVKWHAHWLELASLFIWPVPWSLDVSHMRARCGWKQLVGPGCSLGFWVVSLVFDCQLAPEAQVQNTDMVLNRRTARVIYGDTDSVMLTLGKDGR